MNLFIEMKMALVFGAGVRFQKTQQLCWLQCSRTLPTIKGF